MTIKNVTIVGAGFVGSQIAMDTAAAGYQVTLVDRDQQILNNTQKRIQDVAVQFYLDFIANHQDGENPNSPALNNLKEAERKHNGFSELLKNLHYSPSLSEGVSKADLVIEAVYERLELKQNIFEQIENAAPRSAILATNSSSLKLSDVGKMIKHKDRFGGLHFFNPLERKRLLE
uniref:3-hydroxyacyl-CoA dehydrogenase NAD binding domain-containing protein n=1 Tax=Acrobeloides nanus TaxID=290746 RepID=A0A914D8E3_9BILA